MCVLQLQVSLVGAGGKYKHRHTTRPSSHDSRTKPSQSSLVQIIYTQLAHDDVNREHV